MGRQGDLQCLPVLDCTEASNMAAIVRISVPLQPAMGLRRTLVSLRRAFAVYTPAHHTDCHIKCEQMTLPGCVFESTGNHVQEITQSSVHH